MTETAVGYQDDVAKQLLRTKSNFHAPQSSALRPPQNSAKVGFKALIRVSPIPTCALCQNLLYRRVLLAFPRNRLQK